MQQNRLSIIIVNYNVKEMLLKCIESVYNNPAQNFEIILVDNNSNDGSVEAIRQAFPQVKIIANNYNAGFPGANNQGFLIATGDYIFMLNPDTEIIGDALDKLLLFMSRNSDIALVTPKLLNTDGSLQLSVWRFPSLKYIVAEMLYLKMFIKDKFYLDKDFNTVFEIESAAGAALLFRKDLLNKIGMLDEKLFWIEDVDFCYRIRKEGLKIMYYPECQITHHVGQSAKKNYIVSISNMIFNKIKFYRKHHTRTETNIIIVISFINCMVRWFVFTLLSPFNTIYFKKAKAYWFTIPKVFNPPLGISK